MLGLMHTNQEKEVLPVFFKKQDQLGKTGIPQLLFKAYSSHACDRFS